MHITSHKSTFFFLKRILWGKAIILVTPLVRRAVVNVFNLLWSRYNTQLSFSLGRAHVHDPVIIRSTFIVPGDIKIALNCRATKCRHAPWSHFQLLAALRATVMQVHGVSWCSIIILVKWLPFACCCLWTISPHVQTHWCNQTLSPTHLWQIFVFYHCCLFLLLLAHIWTHSHIHHYGVISLNCLHGSLSDNAQGRRIAAHTKCAEGVFGEWTD